MAFTEKDFQVLEALDKFEITTQRQLADQAGISLGKVNYVLKSLLEKGLVKLGNFRKNKQKNTYAYLLTPKGIEQKSKIAVRFVMNRLHEYNTLREILLNRLAKINQKGATRIIVVGPEIIQEFIYSIFREKYGEMVIIDRCCIWKELKGFDMDLFDMVLISDDSADSLKTISDATGIPTQKLMPLW